MGRVIFSLFKEQVSCNADIYNNRINIFAEQQKYDESDRSNLAQVVGLKFWVLITTALLAARS